MSYWKSLSGSGLSKAKKAIHETKKKSRKNSESMKNSIVKGDGVDKKSIDRAKSIDKGLSKLEKIRKKESMKTLAARGVAFGAIGSGVAQKMISDKEKEKYGIGQYGYRS